jgi:hypothetical protein
MARLSTARRRVTALPGRAKAALVVALVLIAALVVWVVVAVAAGGDDDGAGSDGSGSTQSSTTMATGDLDIDAPDGWQEIPVPAIGFGIAVPPGWEAVLLSEEGLATLAGADPAVPGFTEAAHAAATAGGVLYAAGQDADGRVSDVVVRAAPQTGVTDTAGLETYARSLAAAAGIPGDGVEIVEDATNPMVRMRFQVGAGGEVAEGTETLVLGPNGIVWSVTVTSDDPEIHDDLADSITDTLTLSDG